MRCPGCGFDAPPDHAFCAGCGAPLADIPVGLDHDADRAYEPATETTLDFVLRNLGRTALTRGHVEAAFRDQVLVRDLPYALAPGGRLDLTLPGARAPQGVNALLVVVSVVGMRDGERPFACRGEFRARVGAPPEKTRVRIVQIRGDKNIVDQARFGAEAETPRAAAPRWAAVPLVADAGRLAEFIPPGTPLLVRDVGDAPPLPLGDAPVRFGRKRETNDVVVRMPGNDQASVDRISRNHFTLELRSGRLRIRDLSKSGTLVNGVRVDREALLRPGDRVGIEGAAEYRVEFDRADGCVSRVVLMRLR